MRALVVDDDAPSMDILTRMMRALGWEAESARDGISALRACSRARYDIVLVDLIMPGLGGAEAARAIREAYSREGFRPRVVAVTGALIPADEADNFDAVLAKPFLMEELARAVAGAI